MKYLKLLLYLHLKMKEIYKLKNILFAVIIPTYKELENIEVLVRKILTQYTYAKIFIVDDSPHEDNEKMQKILQKYKRKINIISRYKKSGRGDAVLTGFREALEDKNINYFFEMDADLGHNPEEISSFLEKRENADVISGSRYLARSNISTWSKRRIIMSRIINWFLKMWLGLSLTDYTNGLRMYNRKSIEFLTNAQLKEKGFIALSESAYKLKKTGFTIIEIPISFTDRKHGQSNAGIKEHYSALIGAIRIRFS